MLKITRPEPIDNEIILDPSKVIMSKTDAKGVIQYANNYFMQICGYEVYELMGKPHNVIRHPDMPKLIFKLMWERLHKGENIKAAVKNLAKDGSYYWVITSFETKYDDDGYIISHYARRKAIPYVAKNSFQKLYAKIISIENSSGIESAEKYFIGMLENSEQTYDEFFLSVLGMSETDFSDYYDNTSLNTNVKNDPILKVDFESVEEKKTEDITELKGQINQLKKELEDKKSSSKKGFMHRFFNKKNK